MFRRLALQYQYCSLKKYLQFFFKFHISIGLSSASAEQPIREITIIIDKHFYLTILKFSLGITFSISFFGAGKSILFIRKIATRIIAIIKVSLITKLKTLSETCIFTKLHITLDKIKLRHICVFSIQKLMKSKENFFFRHDGFGKDFHRLNYIKKT